MADIWSSINSEPSFRIKVAVVCTFATFLAVNYASNVGWLGKTNAEVSARFPTPLTPESWAFSIWGIIFLLQALGVCIALMIRCEDPDGARQRHANSVILPWILGWGFASGWQFAFVQESADYMILATVLILASFGCLLWGLLRLYRQQKQFGSSGSLLLYAAYFLPTSIMTSWLSVASAVQLLIALSLMIDSSLLYQSIALILVATGGGLWSTWYHRDSAYALTLLWAFLAMFEGTPSFAVQRAVIIAMGAILLGFIASVLQKRPSPEVGDAGDRRSLLHVNGSHV